MQEIDVSRAEIAALELEGELRDRFVFMLSHDLRNPLSAALMSAELIARKNCNEAKHNEMAHRNIKHLRHADEMITNLLDASRIKAGEPFPLKICEFDLTEMMRDVCEEHISAKGWKFRLDVPDKVLGFWDKNGLKRVLDNLVSNAIKYGEPNGDITLGLIEAGERVILKVHNFGSPINNSDQESLFELFHRTDSARDSANIGWGLGLTLVRGITEAHGGVVRVRSLPTEGTTFFLDLPRDARPSQKQSVWH